MQSAKEPSPAVKPKEPVVVGITGHRDIRDPEDVGKKLALFWKTIRRSVGEDTPVILLTSIASGADHLAARSCPRSVGYRVVLPFSEEEYRKDFSGRALTDFEEDLRGACGVIECDAAPGDYAPASDYVRKHCDVLLTMWDGYETLDLQKREPDKGGTYYQIRAAFGMDDPLRHNREKKHLVVNIAVEREKKGPLYHRERGERQVCRFPEKSGPSVLSWNREKNEIELSCGFQEWAAERRLRDGAAGGEIISAE